MVLLVVTQFELLAGMKWNIHSWISGLYYIRVMVEIPCDYNWNKWSQHKIMHDWISMVCHSFYGSLDTQNYSYNLKMMEHSLENGEQTPFFHEQFIGRIMENLWVPWISCWKIAPATIATFPIISPLGYTVYTMGLKIGGSADPDPARWCPPVLSWFITHLYL